MENLKTLRIKYINGNRTTKDRILSSVCPIDGYHRKSAIRLMNGELRRLMAGKPKATRNKPGTKSRYQDPGFKRNTYL